MLSTHLPLTFQIRIHSDLKRQYSVLRSVCLYQTSLLIPERMDGDPVGCESRKKIRYDKLPTNSFESPDDPDRTTIIGVLQEDYISRK